MTAEQWWWGPDPMHADDPRYITVHREDGPAKIRPAMMTFEWKRFGLFERPNDGPVEIKRIAMGPQVYLRAYWSDWCDPDPKRGAHFFPAVIDAQTT